MGSFKEVLKKYQLEKWFQRDNLIVLVLAGILLVVVALPTKEQEKKEISKSQETLDNHTVQEECVTEAYYGDIYEYTTYLEEKLENTLVQMKGVGKVSVMITLESSEKLVVEKEESLARNNTIESDSEGGNRSVYEITTGEQTVYEKTDSVQTPYVTQTILPEISGVVIVAQGAGTTGVKRSIIEIAQVLFDIEAHKISVVSMNEKIDG